MSDEIFFQFLKLSCLFSYCCILTVLYILWIQALYQIHDFANIFSQAVACRLILLMICRFCLHNICHFFWLFLSSPTTSVQLLISITCRHRHSIRMGNTKSRDIVQEHLDTD